MRHPRTAAGRPLLALLLLVLVAAVTACEPETEPDDATMTNGLFIMSGEVGAVTLRVRDETDPGGRTVALPEPATTWVSAGRTNVLLATLVDGRTFVSDPLDQNEPEWRLVEAVTVDDVPPALPLYYGTWDPAGGAYAQLGVEPEGADVRVVVTDPTLQGASEAPLPEREVALLPPAWIDDDRVVVVISQDGRFGSLIVDTPSGDVTPGPEGLNLVTTSADAVTTALWRGPGNPVEVLPTESWLDGGTAAVRIDPPEDGRNPVVLALDRAGDRLAIAWDGPEGSPPLITVSASSREWATVASFELGNDETAAVGWLR
jgi:hypothetical protein